MTGSRVRDTATISVSACLVRRIRRPAGEAVVLFLFRTSIDDWSPFSGFVHFLNKNPDSHVLLNNRFLPLPDNARLAHFYSPWKKTLFDWGVGGKAIPREGVRCDNLT